MTTLTLSTEAPRLLTKTIAPGTCGELVQGHLNGRDFLVNCPIDLYAEAEVTSAATDGLHLHDAGRFHKIRDTLTLAAHECFLHLRHGVRVRSGIPRGKGMASSSADIGAALSALLTACGRTVSEELFAKLLTEVEPSDCVHFRGIAHLNHITGDLIARYRAPGKLRVLIVDCGGEIDTLVFDRQHAREVYRANEKTINEAVTRVSQGLKQGDLAMIGQAATISAELSQLIHRKPQLTELIGLTRPLGALGVNCAHSGSVLGVMYRADERLGEDLRRAVSDHFGSSLAVIGDHAVIDGGCHVR
jgi:L-threonine kinase